MRSYCNAAVARNPNQLDFRSGCGRSNLRVATRLHSLSLAVMPCSVKPINALDPAALHIGRFFFSIQLYTTWCNHFSPRKVPQHNMFCTDSEPAGGESLRKNSSLGLGMSYVLLPSVPSYCLDNHKARNLSQGV